MDSGAGTRILVLNALLTGSLYWGELHVKDHPMCVREYSRSCVISLLTHVSMRSLGGEIFRVRGLSVDQFPRTHPRGVRCHST